MTRSLSEVLGDPHTQRLVREVQWYAHQMSTIFKNASPTLDNEVNIKRAKFFNDRLNVAHAALMQVFKAAGLRRTRLTPRVLALVPQCDPLCHCKRVEGCADCRFTGMRPRTPRYELNKARG